MKSKSEPKVIHIHAKCEMYETFEQVDESKAVKRLKAIRGNFLYLQKRHGYSKTGQLVVKTRLVNPTLFMQ